VNRELLFTTLRNVILAGAYVYGVSQLMFYGEHLFDQSINQSLIPFAMLLLFALSVTIVGSLVLGQAVLYFLENKKSESLRSAAYSISWLFLITLVVFVTMAIIK